jgi:predicted GNAT family acetyltransferase
MSTEVRDNPDASRYEIVVDGAVAGFARYRRPDEGTIAFTHTEVDEAYAGQGLAKVVARESLDDVRGRGLAVLPFCPFYRGFIAKNAEYLDLVPEDKRAQFDLA